MKTMKISISQRVGDDISKKYLAEISSLKNDLNEIEIEKVSKI